MSVRTIGFFACCVCLGGIAVGQVITEFPAAGVAPGPMIQGPDGNLYFPGGRVSMDGTFTAVSPGTQDCGLTPFGFRASASSVNTLAFDPAGNLWLTMDCVGTPLYPPLSPTIVTGSILGKLTATGLQGMIIDLAPSDLIAGSDGTLWMAAGGIGEAQLPAFYFWRPVRPAVGFPLATITGLTQTPDGTIWFTGGDLLLGRVAENELVSVASVPQPGTAYLITFGPDGNFWITGSTFTPGSWWNWIARCTPAGRCDQFNLPNPGPLPALGGIAAGPDGNVWFTEPGSYLAPGNKIGRIAPDGTITEFTTPTANAPPSGITAGPDGNIWFTEPGVGKVARFSTTSCSNAQMLCLNNGRFSVTASFQTTPSGPSSPATAVPLTNDTGYFWFFDPANIELVTKVLNGCSVNGNFWFFAGGLTDVRVDIEVTDTLTGRPKSYSNSVGTAFQPIQDSSAFSCP